MQQEKEVNFYFLLHFLAAFGLCPKYWVGQAVPNNALQEKDNITWEVYILIRVSSVICT